MKKEFSAKERESYLKQMAEKELDLLVIGGGITGAGIAWDASLRGLKVGLLEMNDFAFGTSSRSTKLVHGGLRYLKQGEIKLVREVGRERALLHKRLPHLVEPIPMVLPIYKGGTYGYWTSSIGIYIYDWLAGVKRGERRKMYNRQQTMELEPLFKTEGLKGSGYYYEYRTDDARLTMEIMKTARTNGALLCNYAKVKQFFYKDGRIVGLEVEDRISGEVYTIFAKKIVNATGPWVDHLRRLDNSLKGKHLLLTKGVHLVVDYNRLPIKQAAYFDVPDGRMIFVIPRGTKTYIGTTDTVYNEDPAEPTITEEDLNYLIEAVNNQFPTVHLTCEDVESGWAGLRPLIHEEGKSPSEISRKDEIFVSESGLISIAGGKLTGFRKMAEKVVNLVTAQLEDETGIVYPPCLTDRSEISGGEGIDDLSFSRLKSLLIKEGETRGLENSQIEDLISRYGTNTRKILYYYDDLMDGTGGDDAAKSRENELLFAEMLYSVNYEMTVRAVDFLLRRTGWIFFDRYRAERNAEKVIAFMAKQLGWDEGRIAEERKLVQKEFDRLAFTPKVRKNEQADHVQVQQEETLT